MTDEQTIKRLLAGTREYSLLRAQHLGEENVRLRTQNDALVAALRKLLCMLPSADETQSGRIPAGFCYVRWQDINDARDVLNSAQQPRSPTNPGP